MPNRRQNSGSGTCQTGRTLLQIIGEMTSELRPAQKAPAPMLDSVLDRDLGIDSLGRVEMMVRIEQAFGIRLPDSVLLAETVRDVLKDVLAARGAPAPLAAIGSRITGPGESASEPIEAQTLPEALAWHVAAHPERTHVHLYADGDEPLPISYGELLAGAEDVAAGLLERGLQRGETVAIMLPTGSDYLFVFFGIMLAGGVPVPIYPPARPTQLEEHLRRHARILDNAQTTMLITVQEAKRIARLLKSHVLALREILTVAELSAPDGSRPTFRGRAQDIAFLQYTSGSTSDPKGVIITHANLLANLRATGRRVEAGATEVFVSWLPLYHDMGLIGAWMGSLYFGMPLALMSPLRFLARPSRWLWAIHRHGGNISASPNFGYEMCVQKIKDTEIEGLDLSSWRFALNGAEPISPDTLRRFTQRFAPYGFKPEAMSPVYGLAESTVGLAFPLPGEPHRIDHVMRDEFRRTGQALPADEDVLPLRFVACGQPISGQEIRVVDAAGIEVPERQEGKLQFKGESAISGYYRNPDATRELFDGEWLESGDRAYFAEGQLYITGRVKEIIIRAGRNIHPYELEEAVGNIDGIRKGCVAVFGSEDPASATERLVVVAETVGQGAKTLQALRQEIRDRTLDLVPVPPDDVVLVPPRTVLKTSSGKIRRNSIREIYERGDLGRGGTVVWLQFVRLALSAVVPAARRLVRAAGERAYAVYAWGLFGLLAPLVCAAVLILPRFSWRWAVVRIGAKLLGWLTWTRLIVRGLENVPHDSPFVLVANHASYVDPMLLCAAIPTDIAYVAKSELTESWLTRAPLARLGSVFVERLDQQRGAEDAQRVTDSARAGQSLGFFPEGTFSRVPGVRPFHMGAFVAAAQSGLPVVPVTIRGSRNILRDESWFPRRGAAWISIGEPLWPKASDWQAAVELRDAARAIIVGDSGEPDLGAEPVP